MKKTAEKGRLGGGLWWLYDVLAEHPAFVPEWEILDEVPSAGSRAAETAWRERRRHEGWQVTSDF